MDEDLKVGISLEQDNLSRQIASVKTQLNNLAKDIEKIVPNTNNINNAIRNISNGVNNATRSVNNLSRQFANITNSITVVLNKIQQLKSALSGIKTNITIKSQVETGAASSANTASIMSGLAFGSAVGPQMKQATNTLNAGVANAGKAFADQINNLLKNITQSLEGILNTAKGIPDTINNGIQNMFSDVAERINSLPNMIKEITNPLMQVADYFYNKIAAAVEKAAAINSAGTGNADGLEAGAVMAGLVGNNVSNATAATNQLNNALNNTANQQGRVILNFVGMGNAAGQAGTRMATVPAVTGKLAAIIAGASAAAGKLKEQWSKVKDEFDKSANSLKNTNGLLAQTQVLGENCKKAFGGFGSAIKGIFSGIGNVFTGIKNFLGKFGILISIIALINGIKKATTLAMNEIEDTNLITAIFGNNTAAIQQWGNTLYKTLGLNAVEMEKYAGKLYNIMTNSGMTSAKSLELSKNLSMLSADFASFYNIDQADAFEKIQGGLIGQSKGLRELGILVDANALKQYGYSNSLSNSEKMMVRYNAIMAQASAANGDLAKVLAA